MGWPSSEPLRHAAALRSADRAIADTAEGPQEGLSERSGSDSDPCGGDNCRAETVSAVQEQALIERAQRGDREAFEALVELHQGAVYGYLRARLLQPNDAEDLTQEVFLRCYQGWARFDANSLVRPWLIGIARNLLREHTRKVKRRKEVAWTELCLDLEELLGDTERTYEDVVGHLPVCLDGLGESAKQALDLRYGAKLRLAEIGDKLKRSEGAVKLLMFRARQALKHCLDGKLQKNATHE